MPWANITLTPGINVETTDTLNQSGYTDSQLIRFKSGLAQKLGGWEKYYPHNVGGSPRAVHAWQDLLGDKQLAIGTTSALINIIADEYLDISPQLLVSDTATNFATTLGSPIVTIVDTNISTMTTYNAVFFNTPISVGGIILSGVYQITQYISATSYKITAETNATSTEAALSGHAPTFTTTIGEASVSVGFVAHGLLKGDDIVFPMSTTVGGVAIGGRYVVREVSSADAFIITSTNAATATAGPTSMNGGNARLTYYISLGPQATKGLYGVGVYGVGVYGNGSAIVEDSGTPTGASDWTLDNWGELLLSCPENGGIYYWGPSSGFLNCSLIVDAPFYNTGMFVSIAQQMIIAYGSTVKAGIGVYQDPMFVKWCDPEDFTTWTATDTNQAGSYRIPTGSKIVGGAATSHQNLIWTDLDLWSMTYIGAELVFAFNKIGANCGLIARHAKAQSSDAVYWMGINNFFSLSGAGVAPMACPVWDAVFQDLDLANADQCHAGSNSLFNEIWFFYPSLSGGLGICDKYVKFNSVEGTWDLGTLQRNTWLDNSVLGSPVATTDSGAVYAHELGLNADAAPISYFYETGWFYIDGGRTISFVDRIIPDFKWGEFGGSQNASVKISISTVNYPGDTPVTYGPYTVSQATNFISKRFRARQIKFRFEGDDMESFSRLGMVRIRFTPDGRGQ
jgi:hypothetical protein